MLISLRLQYAGGNARIWSGWQRQSEWLPHWLALLCYLVPASLIELALCTGSQTNHD